MFINCNNEYCIDSNSPQIALCRLNTSPIRKVLCFLVNFWGVWGRVKKVHTLILKFIWKSKGTRTFKNNLEEKQS